MRNGHKNLDREDAQTDDTRDDDDQPHCTQQDHPAAVATSRCPANQQPRARRTKRPRCSSPLPVVCFTPCRLRTRLRRREGSRQRRARYRSAAPTVSGRGLNYGHRRSREGERTTAADLYLFDACRRRPPPFFQTRICLFGSRRITRRVLASETVPFQKNVSRHQPHLQPPSYSLADETVTSPH
ncbi:hypothetical protein HPB50_025683 [Hyalomma asiaticum]|uniref:Uncharacterized protein n=1 Tax=Hyalomma asiaticum TaxID=266040 RepID=A0ACB7T4T6_HYAAI|nr:hypothetical protein HPB50_025683 [Hyalomma asiaticum]